MHMLAFYETNIYILKVSKKFLKDIIKYNKFSKLTGVSISYNH